MIRGKEESREKDLRGKSKPCFNYRTIYSASYWRLGLVLIGSVILTAGNVYLRWSIGEALDTGNLQMSLLMLAGFLREVPPLRSSRLQIVCVRVQK